MVSVKNLGKQYEELGNSYQGARDYVDSRGILPRSIFLFVIGAIAGYALTFHALWTFGISFGLLVASEILQRLWDHSKGIHAIPDDALNLPKGDEAEAWLNDRKAAASAGTAPYDTYLKEMISRLLKQKAISRVEEARRFSGYPSFDPDKFTDAFEELGRWMSLYNLKKDEITLSTDAEEQAAQKNWLTGVSQSLVSTDDKEGGYKGKIAQEVLKSSRVERQALALRLEVKDKVVVRAYEAAFQSVKTDLERIAKEAAAEKKKRAKKKSGTAQAGANTPADDDDDDGFD